MAKATRARYRDNVPAAQEAPAEPVVEIDGTQGTEENKTALLPAYRTYLEGRKGLAQAFRDREQRDQEAYKDAERRYHLCEQAIDNAVKVREAAEESASVAYREDVDRAIERASQTYKDKTKQALVDCKQRVVESWRTSAETSGDMSGVSEEEVEKAMKARERAEIDALLAYRQEVDKALDRASQAYKDRLKQALGECKAGVVEAWRSSMETSARMTGVFEDDRTATDAEWMPSQLQAQRGASVRGLLLRCRRRLLSTVKSAKKALTSGHAR